VLVRLPALLRAVRILGEVPPEVGQRALGEPAAGLRHLGGVAHRLVVVPYVGPAQCSVVPVKVNAARWAAGTRTEPASKSQRS